MSVLEELQNWYKSQCGENWEDVYGVEIKTLDNPGWSITIDLSGTDLATRPFAEITDLDDDQDWMRCWVQREKFEGVGDPQKLEKILSVFLGWANRPS